MSHLDRAESLPPDRDAIRSKPPLLKILLLCAIAFSASLEAQAGVENVTLKWSEVGAVIGGRKIETVLVGSTAVKGKPDEGAVIAAALVGGGAAIGFLTGRLYRVNGFLLIPIPSDSLQLSVSGFQPKTRTGSEKPLNRRRPKSSHSSGHPRLWNVTSEIRQ
jgi:hypothetical protein